MTAQREPLLRRSVLVVGSREWPADKLWFVTAVMIQEASGAQIISGGARGVDRHSIAEAKRLRWPWHEEKADWDVKPDTPTHRIGRRRDGGTYDRLAGYERNLRMLDMNPDLVLAFRWHGSNGSGHLIENALKRGIPTQVYTEDDLRPDIATLDTDWEPITP